jgi:ATP-dependent Clp protease ATP-binding subunit ClpC
MQLYEIRYPELDCVVKFKALLPIEVEDFLASMGDYSEPAFMQSVLSHFVYNINSEVKSKLKDMEPDTAKRTIQALYKGCVSLNPGLDPEKWVSSSYLTLEPADMPKPVRPTAKKVKVRAITKAKITSFQEKLKEEVIGQDAAIEVVHRSLKRNVTGLGEPNKPLGVFLFAGPSGVGKTHLAKAIHKHLYGTKYDISRVDCGEYQEKHQAMTLLGAPPSYVGYDENKGGVLSQIAEKNGHTVLLLDEVEKAHESIWSIFLRLFDEGKITDSRGITLDFRNCVIIMTTNLGNDKIVKDLTGKQTGFGARIEVSLRTKTLPPHADVERKALEAIKDHFKPEFLNRINDLVIFNHLTQNQFRDIAQLELDYTTEKLVKLGIGVHFDDTVIDALIEEGVDTVQGARGMAKVRTDRIENLMADTILDYNLKKGSELSLSFKEDFIIDVKKKQSHTLRKKASNVR